jgi:ribosomal protein L37AE/L43A
MSDKVVTKIRIVKCPKCRNLLPEPQGYDVYKCGGCGTDLKGEKSILIILSKFYSNYVENYKNHM